MIKYSDILGWIKSFFRGRKKKCACKSSCCSKSELIIVFDEKNSSEDDSGSDIEIISDHEIIKVR